MIQSSTALLACLFLPFAIDGSPIGINISSSVVQVLESRVQVRLKLPGPILGFVYFGGQDEKLGVGTMYFLYFLD